MKVLYCYRYGILGGVCTQLINRLGLIKGRDQFEAHLLFAKDHGIGHTLREYPHLYFEPNTQEVHRLASTGGFDAGIVIDTPEYFKALDDVPNLPVIGEIHTTTEKGLAYLENMNFRVNGFIVPSEHSRLLLREKYDIGVRERVYVIPNSINPDLFPCFPSKRKHPRPIFAWIGKLDDHKNWRGFLSIATTIREQGLDAEFWIVGGITAPDSVEADLLDLSFRQGLGPHMRWFPRIEYSTMCNLYSAVRDSGGAVVVTSVNESFGMSVLEALISGCPVVASRAGAIPELAPHKSYLRLYDYGNYEGAANLALEMTSSHLGEKLRSELAKDRAWFTCRFSSRTVTSRYLRALADLVCP